MLVRINQQIDNLGTLVHILHRLRVARDQFQGIGRDRRFRHLLEYPRTGGNLRHQWHL
jgi:hypothetical protein